MSGEGNKPDENIISASGPSNASLQQMLAISTSLTNNQNPNPAGPVDKEVNINDI